MGRHISATVHPQRPPSRGRATKGSRPPHSRALPADRHPEPPRMIGLEYEMTYTETIDGPFVHQWLALRGAAVPENCCRHLG